MTRDAMATSARVRAVRRPSAPGSVAPSPRPPYDTFSSPAPAPPLAPPATFSSPFYHGVVAQTCSLPRGDLLGRRLVSRSVVQSERISQGRGAGGRHRGSGQRGRRRRRERGSRRTGQHLSAAAAVSRRSGARRDGSVVGIGSIYRPPPQSLAGQVHVV